MTGDNVDLHLTQLTTWLVRTIGRALLWAVVGAAVLGFAVSFASPALGWAIAVVGGPLIFAWRLMDASAPFPVETE